MGAGRERQVGMSERAGGNDRGKRGRRGAVVSTNTGISFTRPVRDTAARY